MEPLFLKGVFQEKIWGGSKLESEFNYRIPSDKTGELWAISAHPNGPATVINGEYKGKTLDELWEKHRELFGHQVGDVFPLLTKIIDAQNDLSVQVHPADDYALKHEGELGKTECWYILAAEKGAEIIYGHHAKTKEEVREKIKNEQWDDLLRSIEVKAGDFFYLPAGMIHAIGSGIMILETQQSSDTTYRLYDYDRRDDKGHLRDLHIEESIAVATVPSQDYLSEAKIEKLVHGQITRLVSTNFFTVEKWQIDGAVHFKRDPLYQLVSVIGGQGEIIIDDHSYPIKKANHFILPHSIKEWTIDGQLEIIASQP